MRLLKIKNELKIGCFLQIKSGRILEILWAFVIKQLFHSRLLDMGLLWPSQYYAPRWLFAISYQSNAHSWNNC